MDVGERIKKYRKEKGLSQEALAYSVFVSRTLITKYENGSAFPTEDNLKKIAEVLDVDPNELLSEKERDLIISNSYERDNKFWNIVSIVVISISFLLILLSVVPFYEYSSYDYSNVSIDNPTPVHITGYVSILASTLKVKNPIALINLFLLVATIVLSFINFVNIDIKRKRIIRTISFAFFATCFVLFFVSLALMIYITGAPGFSMNIRS